MDLGSFFFFFFSKKIVVSFFFLHWEICKKQGLEMMFYSKDTSTLINRIWRKTLVGGIDRARAVYAVNHGQSSLSGGAGAYCQT